MGKKDFKYLNQKFDSKVLDLVKQRGIYLYECMSDFQKFQEELPYKEKFYSSLTGKRISDKEYEHGFKAWNIFQIKTIKDYHDLYLKFDVLLLADVLKNLEITALKIMDYTQVFIWVHQF